MYRISAAPFVVAALLAAVDPMTNGERQSTLARNRRIGARMPPAGDRRPDRAGRRRPSAERGRRRQPRPGGGRASVRPRLLGAGAARGVPELLERRGRGGAELGVLGRRSLIRLLPGSRRGREQWIAAAARAARGPAPVHAARPGRRWRTSGDDDRHRPHAYEARSEDAARATSSALERDEVRPAPASSRVRGRAGRRPARAAAPADRRELIGERRPAHAGAVELEGGEQTIEYLWRSATAVPMRAAHFRPRRLVGIESRMETARCCGWTRRVRRCCARRELIAEAWRGFDQARPGQPPVDARSSGCCGAAARARAGPRR